MLLCFVEFILTFYIVVYIYVIRGDKNMLDFVLCDDNLNVLKKLEKMLDSVFINKNFDAQIVCSTTNPQELLDYIAEHKVHVIFLDIDLKSKMSGLDIANLIREKDKNVYIIFTTAHLEYGLMAYKYKTFDYLPKPVTVERLEDTVCRLFEDIAGDQIRFVRLDNNKTIIKQDSILYIQKDGMKVIFRTDSRDYETYSSFRKILPQLPKQFVQCHKSYIVNIEKISNIEANHNIIYFMNRPNDKCYIGPKYKNQFMEVFNYGNFSDNLDSTNNTE